MPCSSSFWLILTSWLWLLVHSKYMHLGICLQEKQVALDGLVGDWPSLRPGVGTRKLLVRAQMGQLVADTEAIGGRGGQGGG